MEYTKLDTSGKKAMLEQRIAQYEAEHYNNQLNKDLVLDSGDDSEQAKAAIKAADDAMRALDHAHECCLKMLTEQ